MLSSPPRWHAAPNAGLGRGDREQLAELYRNLSMLIHAQPGSRGELLPGSLQPLFAGVRGAAYQGSAGVGHGVEVAEEVAE
jgi:hypothetical protein